MAAAASSAAAPELLHRLQEDHWRDRRQAANDLSVLGDAAESAVQGIARRLEDHNWRVRAAAAHALGELSSADIWGRTPGKVAISAVPELITRLADSDPGVRKTAKAPLDVLKEGGRIGDLGRAAAPAVPELGKRLSDEDWTLREATAKVLGSLGAVATPVVPELLVAVADESLQVRKAAKGALEELSKSGDVGDLRAFGAPAALRLQSRLKHEDWRVRCAAAWALGVSGGPAAFGGQQLVEAVMSSDEKLQLLALDALVSFGGAAAPALPVVIRRMHDENVDVKEAATSVFSTYLQERSDGSAMEVSELAWLIRKLEDDDAWLRKEAANELTDLGIAATPALRALCTAITDDDFEVSVAATNAIKRLHEGGVLGSFHDGRVEGTPRLRLRDALLDCLQDDHWAVRLHAAEALAKYLTMLGPPAVMLVAKAQGQTSSIKDVSQRLLDALIQENAVLELGEILDQVLPTLVAFVAGDVGPSSASSMALGVLEQLRDEGLLEDPKGRLTKAAAAIRG